MVDPNISTRDLCLASSLDILESEDIPINNLGRKAKLFSTDESLPEW